jgi:hypothetical protein
MPEGKAIGSRVGDTDGIVLILKRYDWYDGTEEYEEFRNNLVPPPSPSPVLSPAGASVKFNHDTFKNLGSVHMLLFRL